MRFPNAPDMDLIKSFLDLKQSWVSFPVFWGSHCREIAEGRLSHSLFLNNQSDTPSWHVKYITMKLSSSKQHHLLATWDGFQNFTRHSAPGGK